MNEPRPSGLREFFSSFTDMLRLPVALWLVIGAFVVDSMAYFGVLTLMSSYLSTDLGWGDVAAGITVSLFTMSMTLFMLGVGSFAEGFGLRRAILGALALCTVGRIVYSALGQTHGGAMVIGAAVAAIFVTAVGEAILQPVCYSGVKQYTDEKTSAMGYALIYAVMNAFIVAAGTLSAWIRPAVQDVKEGHAAAAGFTGWLASFSPTGIQAANWAFTGITALTFVAFFVLFTKRTEAAKLRPDTAETLRATETRTFGQRMRSYFTEGPFSNPRFLFFIFMLLPVRTLFAHQWLTFPQYILRAYDKGVADHMEWLVNWINPGVIFIGVPLTAALTKKINVYTMMIVGSLVSALPTFLLVGGPDLSRLITYFVVFSIGEALWSARFLEYASELAPPGRVAQYMGLANIPWLLAKGTTGFYSGYMLSRYCPEGVPPAQQHTSTMWLIYGGIAMLSPIGLFIARKWVKAGLHTTTRVAPTAA